MKKRIFGYLPSGEQIDLYTFENEAATLSIMTRGAAIQEFVVYGKSIIGGFDTLEVYLQDTSHQGAVIGRVANRIANASFTMDGVTYNLPKNDNGNCLHGGDGFDHKVWKVEEVGEDFITMSYLSADGEEGFPSELRVFVTYKLQGSAFLIDYKAYPGGKTPIALTNHAYFNLEGFRDTTVEDCLIKIDADHYTEVDEHLIPTGNRPSVEGTVFDLRDFKKMGYACPEFLGFDHNFMLSGALDKEIFGKKLRLAAVARGTSLELETYTDQEGVQFYMGNFLHKAPAMRWGFPALFHGAFCLETQTEPNCVNQGRGFYEAGDVYTHSVVYKVNKLD
jgi:aldose 1-epimerase